MPDIYLLLGSNLGDRETYLAKSRKLLEQEIGEIRKKSSLYETASWGKREQPDFLNQVVLVNTETDPQVILANILSIEKKLGRIRGEKWGSRTIDIDILFYGNKIIEETNLVIPHPFLHERRFALAPLMELNPELEHPLMKKTIKELYSSLTDSLLVKRLGNKFN